MVSNANPVVKKIAFPGYKFQHLFILTFFFLSGISGLIYEVLWTRKLSLIFGSTTVAVSISLTVYLGGLALGAYLWGRRADRNRRALLVYGLLELGIGIYGALSSSILSAVEPIYVHLQELWPLAGKLFHLPQIVLVVLPCSRTILLGGGPACLDSRRFQSRCRPGSASRPALRC